MELRQLRYLVALADERQFTRAAKREHVAQPALSQQIGRLEAEVGTPLVERSRLESTLTQAGDLLVSRARRIIAELEAAGTELAELQGLRRGRVVIGAMQTLGRFDLVASLSAYRERYPGVSLLVREELSGSLAELVASGQVDLSFLSLTDELDDQGLNLLPVAQEELVAVLPPSHRLAGRKRLRLADLAEEQFISFSEGAALRRLLISAGANAGFAPQISVESNEIPRIRMMVARGLGVAVLPRSAVGGPGPAVRAVPFTGRALRWDVGVAWRADRHLDPASAAFLDIVRDVTAEPGSGI